MSHPAEGPEELKTSLLDKLIYVNRSLREGKVLENHCHCLCIGLGEKELEYDDCTQNRKLCEMYRKETEEDRSLFKNASEINARHRSILLDWMACVCDCFLLSKTTYYLSMNFADKYMMKYSNLSRKGLHRLGIAVLFMGCKIEEVARASLDSFLYISEDSYTGREILSLEVKISKVLNWDFNYMGPINWLYAYLHTIDVKLSKRDFELVTFLIDVSSMDIESKKFPDHMWAASAIYLVVEKKPIPEHPQIDNSCSLWLFQFYEASKDINIVPRFVDEKYNDHQCPIMADYCLSLTYLNNLNIYRSIKK